MKYSRGQPVRQWARIPGRAAEGLDATIYAMAARHLVGIELHQRAEELRRAPPPTRPTAVKSAWMSW